MKGQNVLHFTFMGTGTSHGMPVIACSCPACTSRDEHDTRYRCSAYVTMECDEGESGIVVDTGPEFRLQALKYKIKSLDAILLTHSHADHLHGLDDVRIFGHTASTVIGHCASKKASETACLPVYANTSTMKDVQERFAYIFKCTQLGGGKPKINMIDTANYSSSSPIVIKGVYIIPVPLMHGNIEDSGWIISRIGDDKKKHSIVYLTDCNYISDESLKIVQTSSGDIEHLVIDALREKPHSTHFCFGEAMSIADKIKARHIWFTHICHDASHEEIKTYIAHHISSYPYLAELVMTGGSVAPSYDGLSVTA